MGIRRRKKVDNHLPGKQVALTRLLGLNDGALKTYQDVKFGEKKRLGVERLMIKLKVV